MNFKTKTRIASPSARNDEFLKRFKRQKIAVLCGGWSAERAISLKSGAAVCAALKKMGLPFVKIDVTRRIAQDLARVKPGVAFLATHGPFGEDGRLQGLLDILKIPYTGSGVLASAVAMHKPSAKRMFDSAGLPTPEWFSFTADDLRQPRHWKFPWVVKPASQGSALGVTIVRRPGEWAKAVRAVLNLDEEILAERFVPGVEITVAVLGRDTLPVVEIVPKHAFYDFYSKYASGGSRHLVPARLPAPVLKKASQLARAASDVLGCRHFSRVDLMVPKTGTPMILEVNTLPGFTSTSLFPDAAHAAGISFEALVARLLVAALEG
jgi:D-alanine-D-alanine ligase